MCSTIRPRLVAHCFSFLQVRQFLKRQLVALPTEIFFRLVARSSTGIRRLEMCSAINPRLMAHCFSFLQIRNFGTLRQVALTITLF